MIRNTCGKFQSNTSSGYLENLENIHLHAKLNIGILSSKGAITHPLINSELLFLLCLIGSMIRNTCGKFQSYTSSGYLENLENIHLHANLNIGILSSKGAITHP